MSADWRMIWKEAVSAAAGEVKSRAEAGRQVKRALEVHKTSIGSVLAAFADGKIDDGTLDSELADEKRILTAELVANTAVGPKRGKNVSNAFFTVIENAAGRP